MMARLIDAEKVRETYRPQGDKEKKCRTLTILDTLSDYLERAIDHAPTVDPVHAAGGCYCRECEHLKTYRTPGYPESMHCNLGDCGHGKVKPDDFCSRGKRQTEMDGDDHNEN